jgi:8-oxo-dGTP diphosphatase
MDIPNTFYRTSIKALVLDETRTKFLIVQEDNGLWELPGGGLDFGENIETCLTREIKEEMGLELIKINPNPSYFFTFFQPDRNRWTANLVYEVVPKNLDFTPSEECLAVKFVTSEEAAGMKTFPNVAIFAQQFNPEIHKNLL